jgi:hypothetical protein
MECYKSKVKLLGLLGLTCVMVSMSYFCTTLPDLISSLNACRHPVWAGAVKAAFDRDGRLTIKGGTG